MTEWNDQNQSQSNQGLRGKENVQSADTDVGLLVVKIDKYRPTLEATAPKVNPESFFVESAAVAAPAGAAPNVKPEGLLLSPAAAVVVAAAPNLNPPPSVLQKQTSFQVQLLPRGLKT